jgi:trehalose synthase
VALLREVAVPALALSAFERYIGAERQAQLESAAEHARTRLAGRRVWSVNSTASGGGVAEMLATLVSHARGAGVDARWLVIEGDPTFFEITKRIHNRLHGVRGDAGALGEAETAHYLGVLDGNAGELLDLVHRGDVVLLHDPQTAGMAHWLAEAGIAVVWRCHVGTEVENAWTDEAWAFLRPHLAAADVLVFSRKAYVPAWVPPDKAAIIAPSIDPFSSKNMELPGEALPALLGHIGLLAMPPSAEPVFTRLDGTSGRLVHRATIVGDPLPTGFDGGLVVQVSRWDRLKDMQGVMAGFAEHLATAEGAELALVGPAVSGVSDDPEGAEVLSECMEAWERLPAAARRRVRLVVLPMEDVDENAVMVNAVQRTASVIVQKSLAEGFGLTVAEGMWKGKAVVASRVGGIVDQVTADTGILLDDPADVSAFGAVLASFLADPGEVRRLGTNARRRIVERFLGDRHLLDYAALVEGLLNRGTSPAE